jgi:FkbM family methyltransferase
VDVGANVGLWTLVAASAVGPGGRVFSFEPNPATFQKLSANLARNGKGDVVTAFQQAVSRAHGSVLFSCPADHNLSAISGDPEGDDMISVQTVSLDSVLQGAKVSGMKLDTEGHELSALEGALRTIGESSPWLVIEFNTTLLASPVLADWPVYHFLDSLGYKPFTYDGAQDARSLADSFSISGYCNLLFQRNT